MTRPQKTGRSVIPSYCRTPPARTPASSRVDARTERPPQRRRSPSRDVNQPPTPLAGRDFEKRSAARLPSLGLSFDLAGREARSVNLARTRAEMPAFRLRHEPADSDSTLVQVSGMSDPYTGGLSQPTSWVPFWRSAIRASRSSSRARCSGSTPSSARASAASRAVANLAYDAPAGRRDLRNPDPAIGGIDGPDDRARAARGGRER